MHVAKRNASDKGRKPRALLSIPRSTSMSFTDYITRRTEFDIFPLEETDLGAAAALHRLRFAASWSDGEIHALLTQDTVFGFVARQTNGMFRPAFGGFVLSRAVAGEAEILTIGVDPRFTRSGLGWRLMQAAMREALVKGPKRSSWKSTRRTRPRSGSTKARLCEGRRAQGLLSGAARGAYGGACHAA